MPIYEYECAICNLIFEELVLGGFYSPSYHGGYLNKELAKCPSCGSISYRIMSRFSYNKIGPVSGIDDTDDFTLGKLVQERKVPAEFKPTIEQIRKREEMKVKSKAYKERVKKYQLDKPTRAELEAESKEIKIIEKEV